jgi:anti-anti-sigma factor
VTETIRLPIDGPRFISALSLSGDRPTVILTGEADIAGLDLLEATLAAAVAVATESDVYVDVAAVTFVGATVVDCLVAADQRLRGEGRRLLVVNAGRQFARVLEILQLQSLVASAR